jgi:hypothetical protein
MKYSFDEICTKNEIFCNMLGKYLALFILFLFFMSIVKYFFSINGTYFWQKNYWNKEIIQNQIKIYLLENLKGIIFLIITLIVVKIFFVEGSNQYSDMVYIFTSSFTPLLSFLKSLF